MGEPTTLFGERAEDRRERLSKLMAAVGQKHGPGSTGGALLDAAAAVENKQTEVFYHEGSPELEEVRKLLAGSSLARARRRLAEEKAERTRSFSSASLVENRSEEPPGPRAFPGGLERISKFAGGLKSEQSLVADSRPISQCDFSSDGRMFATCGFSGLVSLWDVPSLTETATSRAVLKPPHNQAGSRCQAVAFSPLKGGPLLAAMSDGTSLLWDIPAPASSASPKENNSSDSTWKPRLKLEGHEQRVNRAKFIPGCGGRFVVTSSHDHTWRLWDLSAGGKEVLCQEGHNSAVYGLSVHSDGSLLCSTDLSGGCWLWDIRLGRTITNQGLPGHADQVLACDFDRWGSNLATGSHDNTVRIFDLRKMRCSTTLQAHAKPLSDLAFDRVGGRFLVTSSHDKTLKIWNPRGNSERPAWSCVQSLLGHEEKVMGCAVAPLENGGTTCLIGSVCFGRTLKLWSCT